MAHGPSFKQKIEVEPFDNIEVYNLLCGKYIFINSTIKCELSFKNMNFEVGDMLISLLGDILEVDALP